MPKNVTTNFLKIPKFENRFKRINLNKYNYKSNQKSRITQKSWIQILICHRRDSATEPANNIRFSSKGPCLYSLQNKKNKKPKIKVRISDQ